MRSGTKSTRICDGLAIRHAFKALADTAKAGTVTEHSETLSTLMYDTAHEFFDAAQAERCRLMFENAVKKARKIPDGAKTSLLELHELYDLKQFDTYGRAGIIVGIAAGLRGMGRQYLAPGELARARLRVVPPAPDEPGGARTAPPAEPTTEPAA